MKKITALRRSGIVIAIFAVAMFFGSFTGEEAYADGLNVTQHSKQDVVNQLKSSGVSLSDKHTFKTQPVYNTEPGELSDQSKDAALETLNNIRYIAGLDEVSLDSNHVAKAQAAAFVLASVGQGLSHYPKTTFTKPSGMPDSIWNLGNEGAGSSNLSAGRGTLNATVLGWMDDGDKNNVEVIGHRRWAINPKMGKVGFGAAYNSDSSYRNYYAEYSFDSSGSGTQTNVAWPARYMPVEYFGKNIPWSLSTGTNVTKANVRVTLTRTSDSPSGYRQWSFSGANTYTPSGTGEYFNVNNDGYGQIGCIIFRPDGISEYKSGDKFNVSISGATSSAITYTVEFINGYPVESASFKDEVFYTSSYSDNYLELETTPKDADGFETQWNSSDESVATVSDGQVNPIKPGTTTVTATIPGKYTKSGSPIRTSCTVIVPKSINDSSVNISVKNPEFTGQVAKPIVTITDTSNNYVLEEDKDYTLNYPDEIVYPSDGSAIVWIRGKGAYSGGTSNPGRYYSVNKKTITTDMITLSETDFTYNGQVQKPGSIVVKNGNLTLVEGTDYTFTNNGGKNAGTYNVTVKGAGSNYTSSANASFTIKPKALTASMLVPGDDLTYTGEAQTPNYSLRYNGVDLVKGTDYTSNVGTAINRGTYTYRTVGQGNYTGELESSFTINPATIKENDIELEQTSFEYDGSKKTPVVTVRVNNKTLNKDEDYELTIDDAVERGSYKITVTGKGEDDNTANYIGGGNKTFEITAKALNADMISLNKDSFEYNAETQRPVVTVTNGGKTLVERTDYTLTNPGGVNAGEYVVVISAVENGNYSGSATKKYNITPKTVTADMLQLSEDSFTYNGERQKPIVTVKDDTRNMIENTDYTLTNGGGLNAGSYQVTLTGKGNYSGNASKTFTIGKLGIGDSNISASAQDVTYTGYEIAPEVTVSFGGKPLVNGDFTVSIAGDSVNVGTVEATIEGKGNFEGQRKVEFNITPKNLGDEDISAEDIPRQILEGDEVRPIPVIKYNGMTLTENDFDLAYEDNTAKGTGKVIVTGKGNFTGELTRTFEIILKDEAEAEDAEARANQKGADGTPLGEGASAEYAEKAILASTSDEGPRGSKFAPLTLKSTKQANTSVTLSWTRNSKAVKYVIYGNACGKKNKMKKLNTVTGKSCKITKISKKLKKGTYHKFMVVALDSNNDVVSASKVVHVATKGGKVGNHKSVTIKAKVNKSGKAIKSYKALTSTKIRKGKSIKIKNKTKAVSKKKKVRKHRKVSYESSNPKVATVSASGKVVARDKGTCYIFAYAQNGVFKRLKITVN